jgi:hypothetical protein
MTLKPNSVDVRMYQVGFGDCFLLSFGYPDGTERHMLIDYGTTSRPKGGPTPKSIAESIEERTGGTLSVLAISHRHRDHLSGLAVDGAVQIIERLSPSLIVLPWTEDPAAAADAGQAQLRLLGALEAGHTFAAAVDARAPSSGAGSRSALVRAAREDLANAEAIAWLAKAASNAQAEYLSAGKTSRISEFIPGIKVDVLGPPTPAQWPAVSEQRAEDPEYWLLGSKMLNHLYVADPGRRLYGQAEVDLPLPTDYRSGDPPPGPDRWVAARLRRQELAAMTTIVRWLDDALNNTSLVLLIEAAGKLLLFPGDAQIENWGWALAEAKRRPSLRQRLTNIDLAKVGHHGSRNGTPRSLHALWQQRQPRRQRPAILLSTKAGVHGKTEATAVPRATLLRALLEVGDVYSTDGSQQPFIEVRSTSTAAGFKLAGGEKLTSVPDAITAQDLDENPESA